jgi:hypothetical protein
LSNLKKSEFEQTPSQPERLHRKCPNWSTSREKFVRGNLIFCLKHLQFRKIPRNYKLIISGMGTILHVSSGQYPDNTPYVVFSFLLLAPTPLFSIKGLAMYLRVDLHRLYHVCLRSFVCVPKSLTPPCHNQSQYPLLSQYSYAVPQNSPQ